ncbi:hypothetical protein HNY73_016937 [Argiope bruennichi]|uniref:Uncharacterized protein n=1 Tax=Argiope bruennichi TaxID=94029 RepID=A0A8T0EK14_ARGBR|nr:hypothetical protein HNY73_016937 [Argiope bruennichi]
MCDSRKYLKKTNHPIQSGVSSHSLSGVSEIKRSSVLSGICTAVIGLKEPHHEADRGVTLCPPSGNSQERIYFHHLDTGECIRGKRTASEFDLLPLTFL